MAAEAMVSMCASDPLVGKSTDEIEVAEALALLSSSTCDLTEHNPQMELEVQSSVLTESSTQVILLFYYVYHSYYTNIVILTMFNHSFTDEYSNGQHSIYRCNFNE